MFRALRAPSDFQRPSVPKPLGTHCPYPATHLGPPLCSPRNHQLGPASLLGANPNPRSDPDFSYPRGLVLQCHRLGTTEPQAQTHPATRLPSGPIEAPPIIHDRKKAGPSKPPANFKGPLCQNFGPMLPLPCALPSARTSTQGTGLAQAWRPPREHRKQVCQKQHRTGTILALSSSFVNRLT